MRDNKKIIWLFKNKLHILCVICLILIICIGFTEYRPFTEIYKGYGVKFNDILYKISLSFIITYFFWIVNSFLPERKKKNNINPIII